jgi:hypothetical protein
MKKWQIILASLLAVLVIVVTPLSIMAARDNKPDIGIKPNLKGALAIVAPRIVQTGSEMSLTVFLRKDQTPVPDVGVWALSKDSVTTLREDVKALKDKGLANLTEDDYQTVLKNNAQWIDKTDENGKILYTFNEPGNYLLVGVKPGYVPDFSFLAVRSDLTISGPREAVLGQDVTFRVTQNGTEEPVEGAGVWAVTRENTKTLREALIAERLAHKGDLKNADWTGILDVDADPMGSTDQNGDLTCSFDAEGKYFLITALEGYLPGFWGIAVHVPGPAPSPTVDNLN